VKSNISVAAFTVVIGLSACAGSDFSQAEASGSSVVSNTIPSSSQSLKRVNLQSQVKRGQADRQQIISPNFYKLCGGGICLTYYPSITPGLPQFIYQDSHGRRQFTYDQIRSVEVPDVGTIVSITLLLTVDNGSTTFSVLLPQVNLQSKPDASATIKTEGITTMHKFSLVPTFDKGQRELYTVTPLSGRAASVIVPL
jgi:hypothetical protein